MKKAYLLSLPVMALLAAAGIAAAYPAMDTGDMTQEEKNLRVQMLELRQEMIQDQIAYLNGDLTQEQIQERLQAHLDEMQPLREQIRDMLRDGEGCACGSGIGSGHMKHGGALMGGW